MTLCKHGHDLDDPKHGYVRPDGRGRQCKTCSSVQRRAKWAERTDEMRAKDRSRYPQRRAQILAYQRMQKYGLTTEDFDALLEAQGHRCAICRSDTTAGRGTWHVDHDHRTGHVRGLLCHACNVGLGCLGDDPDRLRAALGYLTGATDQA